MLLGHWLYLLIGSVLYLSLSTKASNLATQQVGPSGKTKDLCPVHCNIAGPDPSNWAIYHDLEHLQPCQQAIFLDFSISSQLHNPEALPRLRACTIRGADWESNLTTKATPATAVNATYELGWWNADESVRNSTADIFALVTQFQIYFESGYGATNRSAVVFGKSGSTSLGIYLGKALQNEGTGGDALRSLASIVPTKDFSGGLAMQLCEPGRNSDHTFGIMVASNGTLASVQSAVLSWSKAECLGGFSNKTKFMRTIVVTAPPFLPITNDTTLIEVPISNKTNRALAFDTFSPALGRRSDCSTMEVASGDGCGSLASKCHISAEDFMKFNSQDNLCSTLQPHQHVCCSAGTLPDLRPKANSDGSCATYTTVAQDSCYSISQAHGLSVSDLESFNTNTWGWRGCNNLWLGVSMCLSTGSPPMPAAIPGAMCGPQVPGTAKPPSGTLLSSLNPCPLNAFCDIFGYCDTSADFCTASKTGPPGTPIPGTNNACISNCGMDSVKSGLPATFIRVGYFEGWDLTRPCLVMDITQLDTSKYTHIHFAFGTLTSDYQVLTGDILSTFEFKQFQALTTGVKKIMSFGGWDFSTNPNTYMIFRQGVTDANRLKMATNIANFININNLDGVDIDWEYPGATDIPGIPTADASDGANYLTFLQTLKNLLPGKTVSIAAASTYHYLQGFPIQQIGSIVDYIIVMTYDFHGQWDYGNKWTSPGCPAGGCLRSHVNLTETIGALTLINKAGVPSNKVIVGVGNYGRSFQMTDPNCYGDTCTFTGPISGATPSRCTGVAGILSNAEIKEIIQSPSRVQQDILDPKSQTNILVYDNNQWVGWMKPDVVANRISIYQSFNMGGSSTWAIDLEDFLPPPIPEGVASFIQQIKAGRNPYVKGNRTGNWTNRDCTDDAVQGVNTFSPRQRWAMLDCDAAWNDAMDKWRIFDKVPGCGVLGALSSDCGHIAICDDVKSSGKGDAGPAAYEVWNSLAMIHKMYQAYWDAIDHDAAMLSYGVNAFYDDFAPPVSEEEDKMIQIFLDLVGLGATLVAAPIFNVFLKGLSFWEEGVLDIAKDGTYALISAGVSIAKDLTPGNAAEWTPHKKDDFSQYMAQVLNSWSNLTEASVGKLWDGSDPSIQALYNLIKDGRLIQGKPGGTTPWNTVRSRDDGTPTYPPVPPSSAEIELWIKRRNYAYIIPAVWIVSGTTIFVLDASEYPCGTPNPFSGFSNDRGWLTADTARQANVCVENKMYYLVWAKGPAMTCDVGGGAGGISQFGCTANGYQTPPGLDSMVDGQYGGVTLQDLVSRSLNTYRKNGNRNGGSLSWVRDPDPDSVADILNQNITAPGNIRIPVCSAYEAYVNWQGVNTTNPNYPCNAP